MDSGSYRFLAVRMSGEEVRLPRNEVAPSPSKQFQLGEAIRHCHHAGAGCDDVLAGTGLVGFHAFSFVEFVVLSIAPL